METVNEVIEELSKINKACGSYAVDIEEAKARLSDDYQKRQEEYAAQLAEAAESRIDELRTRLSEENKQVIARLHEESQARMDSMDQRFEAHHSEWAQEIVDRILSVR